MIWELLILGTSAATPTKDRHPSAQLLKTHSDYLLIDCGEGTLRQLIKYGARWMRISHILISHLHGDHFYGLPGIITSFQLFGREEPLMIHGPEGLRSFVESVLEASKTILSYDLRISEHDTTYTHCIVSGPSLAVHTIPLKHRTPTAGFLIREKIPPRKLIPEKLADYNIPNHNRREIAWGADGISDSGQVVKNETLTESNRPGTSYAYCSDTAFDPTIADLIKDVHVLYHEATFMHDLSQLAESRGHSTSVHAARLAKLANAQRLLVGHFSGRYKNLEPLRAECRQVFSNTDLAKEGELIRFE